MTSDKENQEPKDAWWQTVKDIVSMASILTGVLIAANVYFGRLIFNQFFFAIGVPAGLLKPTFADYQLVGWAPSALFLILMLFFLIPISYIVVYMRAFWRYFQTTEFWKRETLTVNNLAGIPPSSYSKIASFVLSAPIIAILIVIALLFAHGVTRNQIETGRFGPESIGEFVGFSKVEVLSKTPILPESYLSQPTQSSTGEAYVYRDLYIATYYNGVYILFHKVDQVTCRPVEIFIVYEKDISSVAMSPETREVIPAICRGAEAQDLTLSPTQTAPAPAEGTTVP